MKGHQTTSILLVESATKKTTRFSKRARMFLIQENKSCFQAELLCTQVLQQIKQSQVKEETHLQQEHWQVYLNLRQLRFRLQVRRVSHKD